MDLLTSSPIHTIATDTQPIVSMAESTPTLDNGKKPKHTTHTITKLQTDTFIRLVGDRVVADLLPHLTTAIVHAVAANASHTKEQEKKEAWEAEQEAENQKRKQEEMKRFEDMKKYIQQAITDVEHKRKLEDARDSYMKIVSTL